MNSTMRLRHHLMAWAMLLTGSTLLTPAANAKIKDLVAEKYSETYKIPANEAAQRLAASRDAGKLQQRMARENPDTFGGLYIDHAPEFQIVVLFTKDAEQHLAAYTRSRLYVAKTAPHSLEMLLSVQEEIGEQLSKNGIRFESGIDIRKSSIDLRVLDVEEARSVLAKLLSVVDFINIHETSGFMQTTSLTGGNKVSGNTQNCTMGFNVVEPSTRELGIVTAGHCDNDLTYSNSRLQLLYQNQKDAGDYDVQWNKQRIVGTARIQTNEIVAEGSPLSITSETPSSELAVGAPVCKSGITTGLTCGLVIDTNAATEDYNGLPAKYVRAANADGLEMNAPGDSGGPVFSGETGHRSAYGIVHARGSGDRINDLYFMPIERLSALGISTLISAFGVEGVPDVSGPSPSIPVHINFNGYPRFPVDLTLQVITCPAGWTCTGGTQRYTANAPSPMTFTWGCNSSSSDWPKVFTVRTSLRDASGITTPPVETNITCTGPASTSANRNLNRDEMPWAGLK